MILEQSPATEKRIPLWQLPAYAADSLPCFEPCPIDANYQTHRKGKIIFNAAFYQSIHGELRSVSIEGPKIQIVNIFFFPKPERSLPVYAMEFVTLGARPIVGVIDLKTLSSSEKAHGSASAILDDAHCVFSDLEQGTDPPDWYTECRSGKDFFIRPRDGVQMHRLVEAHKYVWSRLCEELILSNRLTPIAEVATHTSKIKDYKDHHRKNSPGLPFLKRTFGPEWTDTFLRQYLFA